MSDELKPCPFCKSGCLYETQRNDYCDYTAVMFCNRCKAIVTWEQVEEEGVNEKTRQFVREHWNTRVDDAPISENPASSLKESTEDTQVLTDSRERLEADVRGAVHGAYAYEGYIPEDMIIGWLDRQAIITEQELCGRCSPYATAKDYLDTIDSLTAERDELRERVRKLTMKIMAIEDKHKIDGERFVEIAHRHQEDLREIMYLRKVVQIQAESFKKLELELKEAKDAIRGSHADDKPGDEKAEG